MDSFVQKRLKYKFWSKWKMIWTLKKMIKLLEKRLDRDEKFLIDNKYDNSGKDERLVNFMGFIDLGFMDICHLSIMFLKESDEWRRKYFARYAITLMYELTEDITQFLGNDKDITGREYGIRPIVRSMNDEMLTKEMNKICGMWNQFRSEIDVNWRNFSNVRNVAFAHRDHEFLKQYQLIQKTNWGDAFSDISIFHIKFMILAGFLDQLISKYVTNGNSIS